MYADMRVWPSVLRVLIFFHLFWLAPCWFFAYLHTLVRLPAGLTFFVSPKKVTKKRDLGETAFLPRPSSFDFTLVAA